MFTPSNMLIKYLNAQPRDMYDIVGALEGYINADPRFATNDFDNAVRYVLSNGVSKMNLFVPFDPNIDFVEDENKWDYDYYSLARVYLKDNFCEKRIMHVKAIAKKLYPSVAPVQPEPRQTHLSNEDTANNQNSNAGSRIQAGGQAQSGKKTQDQQKGGSSQITQIPRSVKIVGVVVLLVLLVVVIACITK